jgi:biopolymer transport protein ExbD
MDSTMTPMIDVIFQLQIFFLCTAGFALPEKLLPTELPERGAEKVKRAAADLDIVRVEVSGPPAALAFKLNRQPVADLDALKGRLRLLAGASPDLPVVLDIAGEVRLGSAITVYDACLDAGLRKVNFAAKKRGPT